MKLEGEHTLPGKPDQLWSMLLDPDVLVSAIPGCKKFDKLGEDEYKGVIAAKVGAIQSTYTTKFHITDKNPPTSYKLNIEGQGPGGFVNGAVLMELQGNGDATTVMRYSGDAQVGGKIARVGQRMIQSVANMMINRGFEELSARVREELGPQAPSAPAEEKPQGLWARFVARLKRLFGVGR